MATHIVRVIGVQRQSGTSSTNVAVNTVFDDGSDSNDGINLADGLTPESFNKVILDQMASDFGNKGDVFILLGGAVALEVKGE